MGFFIACKAFLKALKNKEEALKFLQPEVKNQTKKKEEFSQSHLQLLAQLQGAGRLIDFLQEDLSSCTDAEIGAAARKVQTNCRAVLEESVTIRPLVDDEEGAEVSIPVGYDIDRMQLCGKVNGQGPYKGYLVHRGWKAHRKSLPKIVGEKDCQVLCPAEVEVR